MSSICAAIAAMRPTAGQRNSRSMAPNAASRRCSSASSADRSRRNGASNAPAASGSSSRCSRSAKKLCAIVSTKPCVPGAKAKPWTTIGGTAMSAGARRRAGWRRRPGRCRRRRARAAAAGGRRGDAERSSNCASCRAPRSSRHGGSEARPRVQVRRTAHRREWKRSLASMSSRPVSRRASVVDRPPDALRCAKSPSFSAVRLLSRGRSTLA